jgi:hypothetical protein
MQYQDFSIGCEFFNDTGRWRCTDVGSRTIIAIPMRSGSLGMHDEAMWRQGPPYASVEVVFDATTWPECSRTPPAAAVAGAPARLG